MTVGVTTAATAGAATEIELLDEICLAFAELLLLLARVVPVGWMVGA